MASNNPLHHPLQTNPASSSTTGRPVAGSSTAAGGGLGRSAPIRTLPNRGPPLAVPQLGLAQTSSSRSKPAVSQVSSSASRAQEDRSRSVSSKAPAMPPPAPSPQNISQQQSLMSNPLYQPATQQNTETQHDVIALPPPQQTQIHPLVSPQQLHASTQQQQSYQPQQTKSPSQTQQPPSRPNPFTSPTLQQSPSQPTIMQQPFPPSRKPTPSTPDEEVDAFLLNTFDPSQSPKSSTRTRPPPLPQTDNILYKAKLLGMRRAWGDILRVTNDALMIKNMDAENKVTHHDVYTELIAAASSSGPPKEMEGDETLQRLRSETCELITLRFISHLKLRRYVDLGKEVTQLGLIPHLPPHSSSIGSTSEITSVPPSPGTEVVPLSSVPTNTTGPITQSLAWKEGSIHSSDEQDRLPSWVPLGLRILAAQQLQYVDGSSKAIDVLYDMRDRATRTEYWSTPGMDVWCSTIDNALVNAFVRKKEWRLALRTLEDMLNGLEEGVEREVEWWCQLSKQSAVDQGDRSLMKELISDATRVELMSRQILILLQAGALDAAEAIQEDIAALVTRIKAITRSSNKHAILLQIKRESALVRQAPLRLKVNEGLLLFARGNYTDASTLFRDALTSQKGPDKTVANSSSQPPGCPSWKELSNPTLGFDAEPSLTVECLNNLSLCLLYSGNMRYAVQEMEGLVREDPTMYLTEGVAFNLCTLYELGSDGDECTRRKKILQRVAKRFFLHDVGVESFRLT